MVKDLTIEEDFELDLYQSPDFLWMLKASDAKEVDPKHFLDS
jgi:hypothetical protein